MDFLDQARTHELLSVLAEQLAARAARVELVVIGGSALLAVGLISRTTRDVDVVAFLSGRTLVDPRPFPAALVSARDRVARDFDLPEGWLNTGPADLLDFGLPDGFVERLERRDYGRSPCARADARRAGRRGSLDADARSLRRIPRTARGGACVSGGERCRSRLLGISSDMS